MNLQIRDNVVILPNGKEVRFEHAVAQTVDFPDAVVIRLKIPSGANLNENVFGISIEGQLLWQIAKEEHVYSQSPYTGMTREGDNVRLFNWDGLELVVHPRTGKIVSRTVGR